MDDLSTLALDSAARAFAALPDRAAPFADRWRIVAEAGLPLALLPETAGGLALSGAGAAAIIGHAAAARIDLPVGEAMVAAMLIDRLGEDAGQGSLTMGWSAAAIYYPEADLALVERDGIAMLVEGPLGGSGTSLHGLPLGDATGIEGRGIGRIAPGTMRRAVAAIRVIEMSGAADAVLALTVDHVTTREQFGRPLAKFQAIQQELARLGTQVAVLRGAAGIAADFLDGDLRPSIGLAAAVARAGEAAGVVAAIALQAHGAIGFTDEYRLGHLTKALWAWRAEAGGIARWQDEVGRAARASGGDGLWALVTAA